MEYVTFYKSINYLIKLVMTLEQFTLFSILCKSEAKVCKVGF